MLILDVLSGDTVVHSVPLSAPVQLGRAPTSDLVLLEPTVSGAHAIVSPAGRAATLRDLGSKNGSFVGGERVVGLATVSAGERFELGRGVWLRLRWSDAAPLLPPLVVSDLDAGIAHSLIGGVAAIPGTALRVHRRGAGAWLTRDLEDIGPLALDVVHTIDGRRLSVGVASTPEPTADATVREQSPAMSGSLAEIRLTDPETGRTCRVRAETRTALLLRLGRQWQADRAQSPDDRGWVSDDDLCVAVWGRAYLKHLANNFNVLLSRVRRSMRDNGLDPWCLERRPGQTRLRLRSVTLDA